MHRKRVQQKRRANCYNGIRTSARVIAKLAFYYYANPANWFLCNIFLIFRARKLTLAIIKSGPWDHNTDETDCCRDCRMGLVEKSAQWSTDHQLSYRTPQQLGSVPCDVQLMVASGTSAGAAGGDGCCCLCWCQLAMATWLADGQASGAVGLLPSYAAAAVAAAGGGYHPMVCWIHLVCPRVSGRRMVCRPLPALTQPSSCAENNRLKIELVFCDFAGTRKVTISALANCLNLTSIWNILQAFQMSHGKVMIALFGWLFC